MPVQIKNDYIRNLLTANMAKPRREIIADFYMTFIGIVVSILAIKSGGVAMIGGFVVIAMLLILLFTPEN
jgi:hypothetical protein